MKRKEKKEKSGGVFLFYLMLMVENDLMKSMLERLYIKYRKLMYSVATNILKDQHLAEDAVHQAFVKVSKHLHKIDEENISATRSYLVIICRNISLNMYNEKYSKPSNNIDELEIECTKMTPVEIVLDKEGMERIFKAIEGLPLHYRDIVLLKHSRKYANDEIAVELGVSNEVVRQRLSRARKLLSKILEKEGA